MSGNHRNKILTLCLAIAGSLLLTAIVLGQAAGILDLSWSTIAGGGGESAGGRYAVHDSLGEPVASSAPSTGDGRYTLTDGFLQLGPAETKIYLPLVNSSS